MDPLIIIFFVIVILAGVGVFVFVQKNQQKAEATSAEALNQRIAILQENFGDQGMLESRPNSGNYLENLNQELLNIVGSFAPIPTPEKMALLNKAGLRTKDAFLIMFLRQIMGAIMGLLIGLVICFTPMGFGPGLAIGAGLAFVFYSGVVSEIRNKAKERSYKIDKSLPDIIDLFANCCVAGVSFDIAAGYILHDLGKDPLLEPIKEDFLSWQSDVNLGMARPESWQRLADRSDSKNIRYFTSLMNQSEKTGGSVAEALFKMSGFFRERRKQRIEAEIATIPTKMSSQTIAFIVLPIIILLMGPVGLNAFRMVAQIFGGG